MARQRGSDATFPGHGFVAQLAAGVSDTREESMIIQLRGRVATGRWDDLVSFLLEAIPFYEEPGGIRVRLLRDVDDATAFIETIEYDTETSYATDQHRVQHEPSMIARLEEWRGLLVGPVEVQTLHDVTPVSRNFDRHRTETRHEGDDRS
jgi:hypothetical protein